MYILSPINILLLNFQQGPPAIIQQYFLEGKGGRCLELTLPHSRADCLEI